jgi:hypothetical protein
MALHRPRCGAAQRSTLNHEIAPSNVCVRISQNGRRDQACSRELLPGAACGFDNFHIVRIQYGEFCRTLRDAHEARDVRFAHDLLLISILHFRIPDKSSVWESTVEDILEEVRLRQPVGE